MSMYETSEYDRPCIRGTEGVEFVPELDATDDDVVVTKNRYDEWRALARALLAERGSERAMRVRTALRNGERSEPWSERLETPSGEAASKGACHPEAGEA
jgi:hypothetical protein